MNDLNDVLDIYQEIIVKLDYIPPEEIEGWITTETGAHIPLRKGETAGQATERWKGEKGGRTPGTIDIEEGNRVRDRVYDRLKNTDFKIVKGVDKLGQSTGVYIVELPNGSKAIWKEKEGMKPVMLREKMIPREVAAYEVDRMLGVNLSPPVAMREYGGKEGYLQGFAGKLDPRDLKSPTAALSRVSNDEIAKAGMMDYVLNQRDRYVGNFRVTQKPSGDYKLRLIDNSTSFGHEKDKLQAFTFLHEVNKRKIDISPTIKERIATITKSQWNNRLSSYLSSKEIDESWERLENVKRLGLKAINDLPLPNWKIRRYDEDIGIV